MTKIFINSGHGGKDVGATGNGLREKDLTLEIGKQIVVQLRNEYTGIEVKHFRSNDTFYSLDQIVKESNRFKPDLFVSVHINAGGGTGFESFMFNGAVSSKTSGYQAIIHEEIMKKIKGYSVVDRGKKKANFAVLRGTTSPATLTETLFIDTKKDAELLKNSSFIKDVVAGHVNGIARVLKLKKKVFVPTGDVYYRVVTGSFNDMSNAEKRMKDLHAKGFDSFIDTYKK